MAALITRLLGHYWITTDHEAIRKAQIADWLQDMQSFSLEVFAEACSRWRIAETKRPTIADMHKLCQQVEEMRREPQEYLPPPRGGFPSKPHHQFLRNKIRVNAPERGPGYFALTDAEKWQYHAYDYAFRSVALHDDRSPIDPERNWYDPQMVDAATAYFGGSPKARRDAENQRAGQAIMKAWANARGFDSADAYADAKGIHWTDAFMEKIKENLAAFEARSKAMKQ